MQKKTDGSKHASKEKRMNVTGLRRPYPLDTERKRRVMVELARRGLTISELARRIDYNQGHVSSCISGRLLCRPLEERIAEFLNRPVNYLFPERTVPELLAMQKAEKRAKAAQKQARGVVA